MAMIERPGPLSLSRQCQLLGLNRAALYYQPVEVDAYELELMALLDRQYLRTPFSVRSGAIYLDQTRQHPIEDIRGGALKENRLAFAKGYAGLVTDEPTHKRQRNI